MSTRQIDPYSEWLGIPPEEQPPSFYRLLGVEEFEDDLDAIDAAGQRVLASVKLRDRGEHGPQARRLLAEIRMALDCLLNPRKKADYDQELHEYYEETGAYGDSEHHDEYELEAPPAPEPSLPVARPLSGGSESRAGSSRAAPASKPQASGGMSPAVIAAIALAGVLFLGGLATGAYFLFLRPGAEEVAQGDTEEKEGEEQAGDESGSDVSEKEGSGEGEKSGAEEGSDNEPGEKSPEGEGGDDGEEKEEPSDGAEEKEDDGRSKLAGLLGGKKDPQPKEKEKEGEKPAGDPSEKPGEKEKPAPEGEKKPAPKEKEAPKPKLREPFEDIQGPLELPALAEGEATPVKLANVYNDKQERVNVRLEGGDTVLGRDGTFEIDGQAVVEEGAWQVNHVNNSGSTPIAQFSYADNQLQFVWAKNADPDIANQLRNCSVKLSVGVIPKSFPLRSVKTVEPLLVQIDAEGGNYVAGKTLDIPGIPDDPDSLMLEITELAGPFPPEKQFDPGQKFEEGKVANMIVGRDATGKLGFRFIFKQERSGELTLEARTMLVNKKRGNTVLQPFSLKPIVQYQASLTQKKLAADRTMEGLRKQLQRKKELLQQAETEYGAEVAKLTDEMAAVEKYLQMCQDLHNQGQIHYRIFLKLDDGREVDLARTEPPQEKSKP